MTRLMQAMQLDAPRRPLRLVERSVPEPGELLIQSVANFVAVKTKP